MLGDTILPEQLQLVVDRYWERLTEHPQFISLNLEEIIAGDPGFVSEISRVWIASEFVANATLAEPGLLKQVFERRKSPGTDYLNRLTPVLAPLAELNFSTANAELKKILRHYHRLEFILIIWRDICEYDNVFQVCQQMSELADACLQGALDILTRWSAVEWGCPFSFAEPSSAVSSSAKPSSAVPQSLVVIGMGKLGANELNVSSDIDLIFAYPSKGNTEPTDSTIEPLSNQQFFTRLGQRLIECLDTKTEDGFVFRMDMRLRPFGSEGALVMSFEALESYYQNQGRDWERYAFIKARAVAGDIVQGESLLSELRPFVYRRYLDFAMLESLRNMKEQIDKQARRGNQSFDIKLGPGGIREIEFIVQALQLVYGGRDKSLRTPSIAEALENLTLGEYLPAQVTGELLQAYDFLRKLEHRLQAFANLQTQALPTQQDIQLRIANAMGAGDWDVLFATLKKVRDTVRGHFREVLGTRKESQEDEKDTAAWETMWKTDLTDDESRELFESSGFEDPQASLALIENFRKDKKILLLPTESRKRLNVFMPILLDAVSKSKKPSLCLSRVMPLVTSVSRRTAYLVLLLENPQALNQLVLYCTVSPFISEYLSKFPVLLDELLDVLEQPPEKPALIDELKLQLLRVDESNFEEQLNCLRYFKQSHILQIAAAEVSGKMPLMKVSDYLTFTAEVILDAVLALSWQHLVAKHGFPVRADGQFGEPDFAIIGYGKLGGIELSYNSDLDLVFLHEGSLDKDTIAEEHQKSINSRAFYIKLAQRIISTLGTYTMAGELYEVDMRLRPSGESGLLVSSASSFEEYQRDKAWTWEHQALVRARGVAGNKALLTKFDTIRTDILSQKRDQKLLAQDVTSMRDKMRTELSSKSDSKAHKESFELKQGKGGVVDIEFLVQYLVLAHSYQCKSLLTFTDNFRILEAAQSCELLGENDMAELIGTYLSLRSASHLLALQRDEGVFSIESLKDQQMAVAAIWEKVFGFLA
jgi:glutamate-ammonia-ligase adenylyltransferase